MFPSPIGELHFSMNLAAEVKKLREEVSVPYRGATFLNEMREHLKISRAEFSFPSPIGELHFSIARTNLIDARSELVSVPYRGATFLNETSMSVTFLSTRFRPLSGSYISQSKSASRRLLSSVFPSPIGELHFSIKKGTYLPSKDNLFPSPIGELHFSIVTCKLANKTFSKFPSPIGELHFSMLYLSPVIVRLLNRFRPLSGSYISQYPTEVASQWVYGFRPLSGSYISQLEDTINVQKYYTKFPSPIGELHFSIELYKQH